MVVYDGRDYFICEHCGSYCFPEPNDEGVRVLDLSPDHLTCPQCGATLYRAVVDGEPALHCRRCQGILLERGRFEQVLCVRRSKARGPAVRPRPVPLEQLKRAVTCPRCRQRMHTHPYYGPGNFIIDNCYQCHLVWLDHGELRSATEAPGKDRGVGWQLPDSADTTGASRG